MINFLNTISLILYCVFIYYLSDQPALPVPMLFLHQDKLHHAIAYFVMAILAWRSFKAHIKQPIILVLISFIFCSLYGASDEWHQSFVEGRDADVADWFADTLGAFLAIVTLSLFLNQPVWTKNP